MIWYYFVCSCSSAAWGRSTHFGALARVAEILHGGVAHDLSWGEDTE